MIFASVPVLFFQALAVQLLCGYKKYNEGAAAHEKPR